MGQAGEVSAPRMGADLSAYVPRLLVDWRRHHDGELFRIVEGSLVSADISGFTKLSERLAGLGKRGAEELTDFLNECFDGMIAAAEARGGDVLKFGGDALLLLFTGPGHTERACRACLEMRATIDRPLVSPTAGRVHLRMSQGVHAGDFSLFLVDGSHRELIVTGPGATATVDCEATAEAGQILLSTAAAARVPSGWLGPELGDGRLLKRRIPEAPDYLNLSDRARADADISVFIPEAQREQIEAAAEGEHRPVTIAFVKFSDTDTLCRERPAELARRLQNLAGVVRSATERYGVHWLASDVYPDGGKIILAAGAPSSSGDDEERMLRAVREIIDATPDLRLRAGVNCGHVFAGNLGSMARRTFTVMGDAVNLAARLMQRAQVGELISSQAVLERCTARFDVDPLEPFLVKGKSMPVHAAVVNGVRAHESTRQQTSPPFVGRERELGVLEGVLADVLVGRGTPVEVVGEPGIGKTRLLQEFAARHRDLPMHVATCGQYAVGTPYFAARSLLRSFAEIPVSMGEGDAGERLRNWVGDVAPDLLAWLPLIAIPFHAAVPATAEADEVAEEFRRARIHQLVVQLLGRALGEGGILIVEEAQWLDDGSRELLGEVALVAAQARWLICTARTEGPAALPPAAGASVVDLGPLPSDAALELTTAVANPYVQLRRRDLELLAERSGGHPLFAIELVKAAASQGSADALPESVEKVVTSAIDTLPATDRVLLRQAAVVGARVDLTLLATATNDVVLLDPARWSTLQRFVEPAGPDTLRFRHALFHQVAYEGLSFRRRQETHRLVGEVLETRASSEDVETTLLSLHFDRAGDHARAWRYSTVAGDEARAIYANVEAAVFYQRALDNAAALGGVEPHELMRLSEALGDVSDLAARYGQAAQAYAAGRRAAEAAADRCRLLCKEGLLREHTSRYSEALRWYTKGFRVADELVDTTEAARLRADLGIGKAASRFRQGKWREVVNCAKEVIVDAEAGGNRRALAHAFYLLDVSLARLGSPEAKVYRGRALPIFEEIGDLVGQANTLNNLGAEAYFEGHWDEAVDLYERSRVARERAGDVIGTGMSAWNVAEVLSDQGHVDRARAEAQASLRIFQGSGFPLGVALGTVLVGRVEARSGNAELALALFADAYDRLQPLNANYQIEEVHIRRSQCLLELGRDHEALQEIDLLASTLDPVDGDPVTKAAVHRLRGIALARAGDIDGARRCLDDSVAAAEASAPFELAQTLWARAQLRGAVGEESTEDRRRAGEVFDRLGVVNPAVPSVLAGVS